eukprot:jgi/Chrzof1/15099/Cz09g27040.t1
MKFVAAALLVLLAGAVFAQTAEGAYCRTSAYTVKCDVVKAAKMEAWKACGGVKSDMKFMEAKSCKGGCMIAQTAADKAAWDKYSACEKSKGTQYKKANLGTNACKADQTAKTC